MHPGNWLCIQVTRLCIQATGYATRCPVVEPGKLGGYICIHTSSHLISLLDNDLPCAKALNPHHCWIAHVHDGRSKLLQKIFGIERHTITIRLQKSGWRLHNGTLAIYCNLQYTVNPKDSLYESQKDISILRTVLKVPEACYREVSHCNVYMGQNAVHLPV